MSRRPRLVVLAATLALALAACGGSASSPAPASQAPATTVPESQAPESVAPESVAPESVAPESQSASACETEDGTGTAAEIKGFAFPSGLSINVGDAITWTNGDSAPHTVTFDDGSCNTQVGAGKTVTVKYTVAGTFTFHCTIHPSMTSSLEVKG